MGYNNDGSCCGGYGFPFGGMGGFGYDAWILLLFFGMWGGGMWGGNGMFGRGWGAGYGLEQATTTAAETAALVGQQQVADRVASIATGVDAVAGLVSAQGTKLETVKDAVTNGFFAQQTNLCELGNNIAQQFNAQTMQGMNNYNGLTNQLTEMRFANAQCCCDTKQMFQSGLCDLRHLLDTYKCDTDSKIAASTSTILAQLNADKFERMQDKLDKANNIIATQKAEADNQRQTATLLAAIQAGQQGNCGCCAPAPCCAPNPCTILTNALYTDWVNKTLNPTTTTAAA
jgi:hypothetical protein